MQRKDVTLQTLQTTRVSAELLTGFSLAAFSEANSDPLIKGIKSIRTGPTATCSNCLSLISRVFGLYRKLRTEFLSHRFMAKREARGP